MTLLPARMGLSLRSEGTALKEHPPKYLAGQR